MRGPLRLYLAGCLALIVLGAAGSHGHKKHPPKGKPPVDSTTATVRTTWAQVKRAWR